MTVAIASTCTACGACLVTCPERALAPAPRRPTVIDTRCTDCWLCLEICPAGAISPGDPSPGDTAGTSTDPADAPRPATTSNPPVGATRPADPLPTVAKAHR